MNASELSEQIRQHVEAGEWSQAMSIVADAWNEASEFGTVICDSPEYPGLWVRFKTRGSPFALRRQWADADDQGVVEIMLRYVTAWNLIDVDGKPIELPTNGDRDPSLLNNLDEMLIVWLIRRFVR